MTTGAGGDKLVYNVREGKKMEGTTALTVRAGRETQGLIKLTRVRVTCPACREKVEAVARDGRVRGYCAVAGSYVDFPAETAGKADAEYRAKMSRATKKLWQDPAYRAMMAAAMEKHRQGRAYQTKMSQASTKLWQDPEYRARMSELAKQRWQDPEYRAKMAALRKQRWQDPEYRARMAEIRKQNWQDPEYRARISRTRKKG